LCLGNKVVEAVFMPQAKILSGIEWLVVDAGTNPALGFG
jgi:hypothetical protein